MAIGMKIRTSREKQGVKIKNLSDYLDVTQQALYQYETDKRMPDCEKLKEIARYLNVTTDYLLGFESTEDKSNKNIKIERYSIE